MLHCRKFKGPLRAFCPQQIVRKNFTLGRKYGGTDMFDSMEAKDWVVLGVATTGLVVGGVALGMSIKEAKDIKDINSRVDTIHKNVTGLSQAVGMTEGSV